MLRIPVLKTKEKKKELSRVAHSEGKDSLMYNQKARAPPSVLPTKKTAEA